MTWELTIRSRSEISRGAGASCVHRVQIGWAARQASRPPEYYLSTRPPAPLRKLSSTVSTCPNFWPILALLFYKGKSWNRWLGTPNALTLSAVTFEPARSRNKRWRITGTCQLLLILRSEVVSQRSEQMADHRHLPALTEYLKKYLWVFLNTKFTAPDIF